MQTTVTSWGDPSVIAQIAAAVATAFAAGVALWVSVARPLFRRPRLTLRPGDVMFTVLQTGTRVLLLRLFVHNASGKDDAEAAQIQIERYSPVFFRQGEVPLTGIEQLRLPLRLSNTDPPVTAAPVASGYSVAFDLLFISPADNQTMNLCVHPYPPAGDLIFVPEQGRSQSWTIEAVLLAKGIQHQRYEVTVSYDGAWTVGNGTNANLSVTVKPASRRTV